MIAADTGNDNATSSLIHDQAAQWSDRLGTGDVEPLVQAEFERWLTLSPEHVQAFNQVDAVRRLGRAARQSDPMAELERQTLARVAQRRKRKGIGRGAAVAASLALAFGVGFALNDPQLGDELAYWQDRAYYGLQGDSLYRTGIGERRELRLDDGSVVTLNTDSRLAVQYQEGSRHVALRKGQALFEVVHDASKPFTVSVKDRRVTALGTSFDIKMAPTVVEVVLMEGSVAVEEESRASEPGAVLKPDASQRHAAHILEPGQKFVAAKASKPVVREVDVSRIASWRDGQLIFRNDRLADAVAEVNRYSQRKITLEGGDLADLPVSGIVNTGDITVFVETMVSFYPLQVVRADEARIVLGPKPG